MASLEAWSSLAEAAGVMLTLPPDSYVELFCLAMPGLLAAVRQPAGPCLALELLTIFGLLIWLRCSHSAIMAASMFAAGHDYTDLT